MPLFDFNSASCCKQEETVVSLLWNDLLRFSMICRFWRGWTTHDNADIYETMLKEEIFESIEERNISGYEKMQLFRHDGETEVQFITIMYFKTLDGIRQFAGEDYTLAVVPHKARDVLSRFDERVRIFEVKADVGY